MGDVPEVTKWSRILVEDVALDAYFLREECVEVVKTRSPGSSGSSPASDAIVGYRTFVAVVVAAYFTLIALTPRHAT